MRPTREAVRSIVAARVGREWCLFLDRDGVINKRIHGDYVRNWPQFELLPNVIPALEILSAWVPRIVVVTNQQGVGKGLMTMSDLECIHRNLNARLVERGVRGIDSFLICPHLESEQCTCRKPNPSLVVDWLRLHAVDPRLGVMVGDSMSDLGLAHKVADVTGGCASVYIGDTDPEEADASFVSLWEFAQAVSRAMEEVGG